jgi:glucose-6-phosphate 1-epimerase
MQQDQNRQHEIPGVARFESGNGGLTKIVVTAPSGAHAEMYLHGAHVTHFQPAGQQPVLWMSKASLFEPNKPIRGGVPICFPWFGPREGDSKAPAHGFARLLEWSVESIVKKSNGDVTVTLALNAAEGFALKYAVTVGKTLELRLDVQNLSAQQVKFEEALHTYLAVGDIKQVSVEGLSTGSKYIDKVGGINTREQSDPVIRFTGETDRVYLDTTSTCVVNDPSMRRKIEIAKSGSNATVVWNPWMNKAKAMPDFGDDEWPGMVCIETVNAAKNAVELVAGATHSMTARVRVI